jgi:hypothetical protein
MSDIPYSVRDKSTRVNAIKGLNFDSLESNELFKKQDSNNATGTGLTCPESGLIRGAAGTVCKIHILPFTTSETTDVTTNVLTPVISKSFTKTEGTDLFGEIKIEYLITGGAADSYEGRLKIDSVKDGELVFLRYRSTGGGGHRSSTLNEAYVYTNGTGTNRSGTETITFVARKISANDDITMQNGTFIVTELWS